MWQQFKVAALEPLIQLLIMVHIWYRHDDDNIDKYIDLSLYCNKKFGISDLSF